jgi:hypothetical protein
MNKKEQPRKQGRFSKLAQSGHAFDMYKHQEQPPEMVVCPKPVRCTDCKFADISNRLCELLKEVKNEIGIIHEKDIPNWCILPVPPPEPVKPDTTKLENQRYWDGVYDAIHGIVKYDLEHKKPEPVKPEEGLLLGYYSPEISVLRIRYEQEQKFGLRELLDKSCEAQLAKLQPELDRREARIKELQEACTYWEKIQPAITAQAKAEAYKEVADKVEGIENPYQEQGIESLNKCIGFGKCREAVKKILGKV